MHPQPPSQRARLPFLVTACLAAAVAARGQTFKTVFESGMDGWIADFAGYAAADSASRRWTAAIGESGIHATPCLRLSGSASDSRPADRPADGFLFVRKRIAGLAPNAAYRVSLRAEVVTAYGQFAADTLVLKAGALPAEPRKSVDASGQVRLSIDRGPARGPGADLALLGILGYDGGGHRFPELTEWSDASQPLQLRTDADGGAWIVFGAEFIPARAGSPGPELKIRSLETVFTGATAVGRSPERSHGYRARGIVRPGLLGSGSRAWNALGARLP
jgi:hypothetical protein